MKKFLILICTSLFILVLAACGSTNEGKATDDENKDEQIEEERRLMYVAITRAEEKLCISSPQNKYGKKVAVSTFINDIKAPTKEEMDNINIGSKIYHKKFKEGTVVSKDGDSIRVKFSDGTRILNYRICVLNNVIHI